MEVRGMSFEIWLKQMLGETGEPERRMRAELAHRALMPRPANERPAPDPNTAEPKPPDYSKPDSAASDSAAPSATASGPTAEANALRRSAVLIPLVPSGTGFRAVLTLRPPHIRHGGQLSFPGGLLHEGESPQQAALRETHEEIGTPQALYSIIGPLTTLHMAHTGTLVTPFVGFLRSRPRFRPEPGEVEQIVEVPLEPMCDPSSVRRQRQSLRGVDYEIPCWNVHPEVPLWGATAMILSELLDWYRGFRGG
mgnify:CR=1 FL=1